MKKKYCLGFAFDETESNVVLILKARPILQRGLLNGIGGHVEDKESFSSAMFREWSEEVKGTNCPLHWTHFAVLETSKSVVWCFRANIQIDYSFKSGSPAEFIGICNTKNLPSNTIHNLRWLIPMAKMNSNKSWPISITCEDEFDDDGVEEEKQEKPYGQHFENDRCP